MKGQYTHYLIFGNTDTNKAKQITSRYDWQTFTYREEERTGKRNVNATLPTDDDLKSDIQAFMDTHSIDYNSSDTKAELIKKIDAYILENGHPQVEESYTYMEEVVDTTTDHEATIQDLLDRHPLYFAPRISPDGSEICIKGDWTITELDAMPNDFRIYTNEECKEYIATSESWQDEE
jgi:hypothetical protein